MRQDTRDKLRLQEREREMPSQDSWPAYRMNDSGDSRGRRRSLGTHGLVLASRVTVGVRILFGPLWP